MNFSGVVNEEPQNGEMLGKYENEAAYLQACDNYKNELDKIILLANESDDWREIRKKIAEIKDRMKGLFLKVEDSNKFNELIRIANEDVNKRQAEEQEKFDIESQNNYDSVIEVVSQAVEFVSNSNDFKLSREKLLSAQDSFKNLRLKRAHKDELYRLINDAFDNVSKKQNEERENYEMECIDNYHNLKHKIDVAIDFANKSEIFAEARKALINVQNQIKGLKLKRDQRDQLYQMIRDAFESVNTRQEEERASFENETKANYDLLKKLVDDAINFAESTDEYSVAREHLISAQNQIKVYKLKREQRDSLFADIRAVFEKLNERQSSERGAYETECNANYDRLSLKVKECFDLVNEMNEFNLIRESLITLQGEVRISRLKKEQRNELFAKIREAFSMFDTKKNEYFEQRKEDKSKKLYDIKVNLEEKIQRLTDVLSKDVESLELQKAKINEAGDDEFLINEINLKISNIEGRIKEKTEVIEATKTRILEIEDEIDKL
jgi:hypothetical protein